MTLHLVGLTGWGKRDAATVETPCAAGVAILAQAAVPLGRVAAVWLKRQVDVVTSAVASVVAARYRLRVRRCFGAPFLGLQRCAVLRPTSDTQP